MKLQKEGKLADINKYKNQVETYNQQIRKVAPAYWKLNSDIQFKYSDEIKSMIATDGKKYAILLYTELDDVTPDVFANGAIEVPSLLYHRGDKPFLKPDVKIPIPSSYARDNDASMKNLTCFSLLCCCRAKWKVLKKEILLDYKGLYEGRGGKKLCHAERQNPFTG